MSRFSTRRSSVTPRRDSDVDDVSQSAYATPATFSPKFYTPEVSPRASVTSLIPMFAINVDIQARSTTVVNPSIILPSPVGSDQSCIDPSDIPRQRMQWSHRLHYFSACGGIMIGIRNLITFPRLFSQHGCVTFLTAYCITLIFMGYPMLLLQMGIAQFTSQGPAGCWEFAPLFKGVGYALIVSNCIFGMFWFNTLMHNISILLNDIVHHVDYLQIYNKLIKGILKLKTNTSQIELKTNKSQIVSLVQSSTASILREDSGIHIVVFLLCWVAIFLHVIPNIPTIGKITGYTFVTFCGLLLILTIRSFFLEGAFIGIQYAFRDTSLHLLNMLLWKDAMYVCFWSLSLETFNHMTAASFNHFNNMIPQETLLCMLMDTGISLVSVLFVFSTLGHLTVLSDFKMEYTEKLNDLKLVKGILPYSLDSGPDGQFTTIIFLAMFTMSVYLQVTWSYMSFITGLIDAFKLKTSYRNICVVCTVLSVLSSSFLCTSWWKKIEIVKPYLYNNGPALNFLFLIATMWVYGVDRILALIECSVGWETTWLLSNHYWKLWWKFCWKFCCPVYCIVSSAHHFWSTFLKEGHRRHLIKDYHIIPYSIVLFLMTAPVIYLMIFTTEVGLTERFKCLLRPTNNWGPYLPHHKHIMRIGEEDIHRKVPPPVRVAQTFEELSNIMDEER